MCMSIYNNNNNSNSFTINPSLKIDHVHLKVSNLKESLAFYQSILGFSVIKEESNTKTTAFLASAMNNTNNTKDWGKKKRVSPLLVLTEIE